MQEITVEFVYSRQQKMEILFILKTIMEVTIIYFFGFSRERRLACENRRFSSLFAAGDVSRGPF